MGGDSRGFSSIGRAILLHSIGNRFDSCKLQEENMPHLMIETFMSQWIWLVIILFVLYYQIITVLIPKVSNSFKARRELESSDNLIKGHNNLINDDNLSLNISNPLVSLNSDFLKAYKVGFASWSAKI